MFEAVASWLGDNGASGLEHAELEQRLGTDMREVVRQLLQDHLDRRAEHEQRLGGIAGATGVVHGAVEEGHERTLATVFGEVSVRRMAYRRRGHANLHPADAALNLPVERHSHGVRRLAAEESSRGSFDEAAMAVQRATGQHIAKRQVEQLARRAAADFEAFYEGAGRAGTAPDDVVVTPDDVVVISADGKGIVMRPDALRPATAAAAT
jgi:hypothetical protein